MLVSVHLKIPPFGGEERGGLLCTAPARQTDQYAFSSGSPACPKLHRVNAVFGPNATGKSTLVQALRSLKLMSEVPGHPGLRETTDLKQPYEITVAFVEDEVHYQYSVVWGEIIFHESLTARPPLIRIAREDGMSNRPGRTRKLFWRDREVTNQPRGVEWKFNRAIRGRAARWRDMTPAESLLLAMSRKRLSIPFLRPLRRWFDQLLVLPPAGLRRDYSANDGGFPATPGEPARRLLRECDLWPFYPQAETDSRVMPELLSDGQLFGWRLAEAAAEALLEGKVLVVDDFDAHLHPAVVSRLLRRFNRASARPAQLLATLHNASVLSDETLDRYQVWFTDHNAKHGHCELHSLGDFHPRKGEQLMRGYLGGRYGGVPNIVEMQPVLYAVK